MVAAAAKVGFFFARFCLDFAAATLGSGGMNPDITCADAKRSSTAIETVALIRLGNAFMTCSCFMVFISLCGWWQVVLFA